MTGHFKQVCEFGQIHAQCRCADPGKAVIPVVCDRPQSHDPAHEGKHRASEEAVNDPQALREART